MENLTNDGKARQRCRSITMKFDSHRSVDIVCHLFGRRWFLFRWLLGAARASGQDWHDLLCSVERSIDRYRESIFTIRCLRRCYRGTINTACSARPVDRCCNMIINDCAAIYTIDKVELGAVHYVALVVRRSLADVWSPGTRNVFWSMHSRADFPTLESTIIILYRSDFF